jgi:hypothetical protein
MAEKIEQGDLAKEVITGFTGVVKGIQTCMHNCDRIGLQPQELKDGNPIDTTFFDAPGVVLVKKRVVETIIPATPMIFNYGDTVADTLTDFKGIVTSCCYWISGCTRVGVQSSKLKDGTPVGESWFPMSQLKLVKAAKKPVMPKPPGGPMKSPGESRNPR